MKKNETPVLGTKLSAWRIFLQGRIAQEKGEFDSAIAAFDHALAIDPTNPSFLKAKAAAFVYADHVQSPVIAHIADEYGRVAQTYVGADDRPDLWIKELDKLIEVLDQREKESLSALTAVGVRDTVTICW